MIYQLVLQSAKETFSSGIIEAFAFMRHAAT
jgi:hypothetical protein